MEKENYFDWVYQVVKQIPEGKVTTYGAIANYLGLKSGARMVGYAMNASHALNDVPAHRVVNRNGLLTGKRHFGPGDEMKKLLEKEGIKIENDQITDFEKHLWNPNFIKL
jgi:methylated-DNA-protein-cysteine methyltransferase related protein